MPEADRRNRPRRAIRTWPRRPGWVLAAALLATAAAAQPSPTSRDANQPPLTLDEALRQIAAHSSAAVTSALDLAAAKETTRRAQASFMPSASVSAGYQARDHEVVARFGALQAPTTQQNFLTGELDIGYLLWDGGRRASALATSKSAEEATALRGQAGVTSAQLEGLASYMRVLALKAQRTVLAQRVTSLQDHLREVNDLFDQGVVARNDLLATEVRLRLVQDQTGQVDNGEAVAMQMLNRLMGRSPAEPLALPASLPAPPPLPGTLDELKKRSADANQQLRALRAREKAEEAVVSLRRSESYPTLFAQAAHTYQQNQYLVYPHANFLFLGVSWDAYDGGRRQAEVREAEAATARTREEIADLQRRLAIEVEQAHREYAQAVKEAATAQTNVKAAEENLRIEEDQYKAGLARTTDVLDAESVLAESRFSLVNRHYDAYLKQGVLLTAAGEDLAAFFAGLGSKGQEQ